MVVVGLLAGSLLASGVAPGTVAGHAADRAGRLAWVGAEPTRTDPVPGSVVANVEGRQALVYHAPKGQDPWRRYSNPTPQRTPLVFLVRARLGSWLRVMLPSRPNGSEGWIRAAGVELRVDPYSVRVDLRDRRLLVREAGRMVLDVAVGLGRAATPTPSGLSYITELLRQPDPRGLYGPWG